MESKECPLCKEELTSGVGKGCMMCGMLMDDGDFCCMKCEEMYEEIHKYETIKWRLKRLQKIK